MTLVLTSLLFLTNVLHAIIKNRTYYSVSFLGLTCTSVWYHYDGKYDNRNVYIYDQIAILNVVLNGAYQLIGQTMSDIYLPVICFILTCITYKLQFRHEIIHLLSIFGHHCIILGINEKP